MPIRSGLVMCMLAVAATARAEPPALLHPMFQDHAVLQRDRPIAVWGQAAGGEVVSVAFGSASARATADSSGRWSTILPPLSAGGPFVLTAQGSSGIRQAVNDILVGDVYLCSGQSNMELRVQEAGDSSNEIQHSSNDMIRLLNIAHAVSPVPVAAFKGPVAWQVAAPETVPDWSAACFFFARELSQSIHVPIGLVQATWGGSNIRPWISAAALRAAGGYERSLKILALYAKDENAAQKQFAAQWEEWWRGASGDRAGTEPWRVKPAVVGGAGDWREAPPGLGDWRSWGIAALQDFTGSLWYRTTLSLTAAQAASANALSLGAINQVDETWINGRSVGNTFGYGTDRQYSIAPGILHAGDNVLVVNVSSTYGAGGLLKAGTRRALQLAGGESIPLGGPWQFRAVPAAIGYPPRTPWESVGGLATLYNAMIAPLGSYGFRGVLWYQGESNTGEAQSYQALLTGMMADWRRQFGSNLAFLIVQLPNFGTPPATPTESGWAAVREAQRLAVAGDAHAGLAVTIDIGEPRNLHPGNKQDVARRLARAAGHVIYAQDFAPSGPTVRGAARRGGRIAVQFTDVERGLLAYSHDTPIGFELCADSADSCLFADGSIDGSRVMLSIPNGVSPTRVRYCWADSPICTLHDFSGLPAGPFETRITD